eukprot:2955100-Rhodomonas_salina.2
MPLFASSGGPWSQVDKIRGSRPGNSWSRATGSRGIRLARASSLRFRSQSLPYSLLAFHGLAHLRILSFHELACHRPSKSGITSGSSIAYVSTAVVQ